MISSIQDYTSYFDPIYVLFWIQCAIMNIEQAPTEKNLDL